MSKRRPPAAAARGEPQASEVEKTNDPAALRTLTRLTSNAHPGRFERSPGSLRTLTRVAARALAGACGLFSPPMADTLRVHTPIDGSVYVERPLSSWPEVERRVARARDAQETWSGLPVAERVARLRAGVAAFVARQGEIAPEITWQMGRPARHAPLEVGGFEERAVHMLDIAEAALADVDVEPRPGFTRFVRRVPLGLVLTVAPWNYPYLTAVNSVVPGLAAGNAVILRHSSQTPLCSERFAEAFAAADLPDGLFQPLHCSHEYTLRAIGELPIDFVGFTGSVPGGRAVQQAAARRFPGVGLELGGKDPAYVRADADLDHAAEQLADGAFFNAGQSCCGIERVYVDRSVYEPFLDRLAAAARELRLGDPREPDVTLGPLVRADAARFVREQSAEAVSSGARALLDEAAFPASEAGTPYLAPQILADADHGMRVMREESFGPVVGVMPVADDDEAVHWMNDSDFGLTASVWTRNEEIARALGARVRTGTWFMNRCDYLDPALAWTGVKDSGRGCTLSRLGYETLTRPQSFHLRQSG